jgi:hypothetical protein
VSLTAKKSLQLRDAGLIKLFEDNKTALAAMAQEAYKYTAEFVKKTDQPVRRDDVIELLVPALEVTERLRVYLAEKRLAQKYWYRYFGELIIDREWDGLTEDGGNQA